MQDCSHSNSVYISVSQTVCRGRFAGVPRVLSNCFLLLQMFCQNRENAAITGDGEKRNGNQYYMGLHHAISGGRSPEKW